MNELVTNPPEPTILDERELDWGDLNRLPEVRGVGTQRLQKIRAVHHKTAQMVAAGMSNVEVAAATGQHPERITTLKRDPAFQELLAHYGKMEEATWREARERAALLGISAVEELQNRLEDRPDDIPTKVLLEMMEKGLDYGGHKSEQKNLHVHTTPEELARAKARAQEAGVRVRESDDGRDHRGIESDGDESGDSAEEGQIIEGQARRT